MKSAVALLPHQHAIAELAVELAIAEGDQQAIESALRRIIRLAMIHANNDAALDYLRHWGDIAPHDVWSRFTTVEIAIARHDPSADPALREVVKYALRSQNYGLAEQTARARVDIAEAQPGGREMS